MVKFGSIGSAAKECVPGLQPFHVLQGVDEFSYFWFVLLDLFPLTPPHFNNLVPASTKGNRGTAGMLPNFIHFSTGVPVVHFRLIRGSRSYIHGSSIRGIGTRCFFQGHIHLQLFRFQVQTSHHHCRHA